MKREYIQPKVDVINLAALTEFLAGSTEGEITNPGDGDDWDEEDGNSPADPWA